MVAPKISLEFRPRLKEGSGRAQALVEQASRLWEAVADAFHGAAAATEIARGSAFKLHLLREPLLAIAQHQAWESLGHHQLLKSENLQRISQLLNEHLSAPIVPAETWSQSLVALSVGALMCATTNTSDSVSGQPLLVFERFQT